ncbi:MAG: hypothetical protein ACXQTP_01325 [Candidatus Methanofastidiosia archaeon]
MNKEKTETSSLQHAFRDASRKIKTLDPRYFKISFKSDNNPEKEIRTVHADLCNRQKNYFPIKISCKRNVYYIEFIIGKREYFSLKKYLSSEQKNLVNKNKDILNDVANAISASFSDKKTKKDTPINLEVRDMTKIDRRYNDAFNYEKMGKLFAIPKIALPQLKSAVYERMFFAQKNFSSFVTLTTEKKADALAIASVFTSFDIGYKFGMPLLPKNMEMWQQIFNGGSELKKFQAKINDYTILDLYLTTLFPQMDFAEKEVLLSNFNFYIKSLRTGELGNVLPKTILENMDLAEDEVDKKIKSIGLIFD